MVAPGRAWRKPCCWFLLPLLLPGVKADNGGGKIPRIVGGTIATPGRYPYVVDLDNSRGEHRCMGVLVAPDFALTAAHCRGETDLARVGRYDKNDLNDGFDSFRVEESILHPLFYDIRYEFDLMLLRLSGQSTQQFLHLNPNPGIPVDGQELEALGFGAVDASGLDLSHTLRKATLKTVSQEACNLAKGETNEGKMVEYLGLIRPEMVCAGSFESDTCQGDSGGPLVLTGDSPSQDLLVGIVSFGFGCLNPDFPGVNARVSAAFDWIRWVLCQQSAYPPLYLQCGQNRKPEPEGIWPPVGDNPIELVLELTTDAFSPDENYVFLERVDGLDLKRVAVVRSEDLPANGVFQKTITLEAGKLYSLVVYDDGEDGIENGQAKLNLRQSNGSLLPITALNSNFNFLKGEYNVLLFYATLDEPATRFDDNVVFPGGSNLSLEIDFDSYPHEIAVEIRFLNGTLLFYRPPGFYASYINTTLTEVISFPLDEPHDFILTVADTYGDGFDDADSAKGYFLKDTGLNQVLLSSDFPTGRIETKQFTWPMPKTLDCSFQDDIQLRDNLVLRQIINQNENTLTVQMEYDGLAWLGFGFNEFGEMLDSTAVIGLPDSATDQVRLYNLGGYSTSAVTPLPNQEQGMLMGGSVLQDGSTTVLTFTMPIMDEQGQYLALGGETSRIIYAVGSSNTLAYHDTRGSVEVEFTDCLDAVPPVAPPTAPPSTSTGIPPKKDPPEDDSKDDSSKAFSDVFDRGGLDRKRRQARRLKGA